MDWIVGHFKQHITFIDMLTGVTPIQHWLLTVLQILFVTVASLRWTTAKTNLKTNDSLQY